MNHISEPQESAIGRGMLAADSSEDTRSGSGSVRAADGSTIAWITAPDETITATGTAGRQMVFTSTQQGDGVLAQRLAFSTRDLGTYLTIDNLIDQNTRTVTVGITGGGSAVTIAISSSGETTATGVASGTYGATRFRWSGQVNLSAKPVAALAGVPGFNGHAFDSQFAEASYFAPACRVLSGIPDVSTRRGRLPPPGEFWGSAVLGGFGLLVGGVLFAPVEAPITLLVGVAAFALGMDLSMAKDLLHYFFGDDDDTTHPYIEISNDEDDDSNDDNSNDDNSSNDNSSNDDNSNDDNSNDDDDDGNNGGGGGGGGGGRGREEN